jgi:hypothetical protein
MYKNNINSVEELQKTIGSPHELINVSIRELTESVERLESFLEKIKLTCEKEKCVAIACDAETPSLFETLRVTPDRINILRERVDVVRIVLDELLFNVITYPT